MDSIQSFLNDFSSQFKKEGQYITWLLVLIGWVVAGCVAFIIAKWQESKNIAREHAENTRRNLEKIFSLKRDLTSRITQLEDESIDFWLSPPSIYQKDIDKFSRDIKIITGIAREIDGLLSHTYPSLSFRHLRRAITLYSDTTVSPESYQGHRIQTIRDECIRIRNHYQ
ncbi:hypothetical protein J9885_13285 [Aeromonas sp. SrichE-2G]|uniref:hypothetical protein n=1 Tax=Aeromonas sp. SrichE-2G TaxID=2823359 RepID=UPI001B321D6A|nr:hypothetical protein [Aeromonas sp. SrichE-2G]MBP4042217.1 hypothetical protein [Aeromonas sp. SrichE-2G]